MPAPDSTDFPNRTWSDFVASVPPNELYRVEDLWVLGRNRVFSFNRASPKLHCDNEHCERESFFDLDDERTDLHLEKDSWDYKLLFYQCRHCKKEEFVLAIGYLVESGAVPLVWKIGQFPKFGERIPAKLAKLLSAERNELRKALDAEAAGLGVAALTYYRRVVERQRDRLFDEIIKVLNRLPDGAERATKLAEAKRQPQFSKSLEEIKDLIPQALLIDGQHNPIKALHGVLSNQIHSRSDSECLMWARDIRVVLTRLAELLAQALKDEEEVRAAFSRLQKSKSSSKSE